MNEQTNLRKEIDVVKEQLNGNYRTENYNKKNEKFGFYSVVEWMSIESN